MLRVCRGRAGLQVWGSMVTAWVFATGQRRRANKCWVGGADAGLADAGLAFGVALVTSMCRVVT